MIDLGLTTGIKDLWQENLLRDYTLVVEGREIKVHRVVLAAVSGYFKAIFGDGFLESKEDKVNVNGFSSDTVCKLLSFIYTGEENIITDDTLEVLRCSMYLQMPLVSQFCAKKLVEDLTFQNCVEVLSSVVEFTFPEVTQVRNFIRENWGMLVENYSVEALSYDTVELLIHCSPSEWETFLFLKNWSCGSYQERLTSANHLMSRVRFRLIAPDKLQVIRKMDIYWSSEGTWQDLVDKAVEYHKLPINLKVLDRSKQSEVKSKPRPVFFANSGPLEHEHCFYTLDQGNTWQKHRPNTTNSPVLAERNQVICKEVNNFMVVCVTSEDDPERDIQKWFIFDPRTLAWEKMTGLKEPKVDFRMVPYNDDLYLVGGQYLDTERITRKMERYSFRTDKWTCVHDLPVALNRAGTCVIENTLYISGGHNIDEVGKIYYGDEDKEGSDGFYCLNLSSPIHDWQRKTPCLDKCAGHCMFAVKRTKEEALLIVQMDLKMQLYSPSTDQWVRLEWTGIRQEMPHTYEVFQAGEGMVLATGNALFMVRTALIDMNSDEDDYVEEPNLTMCWEIPEAGQTIKQLDRHPVPDYENVKCSAIFGAVLAFPTKHPGQDLSLPS